MNQTPTTNACQDQRPQSSHHHFSLLFPPPISKPMKKGANVDLLYYALISTHDCRGQRFACCYRSGVGFPPERAPKGMELIQRPSSSPQSFLSNTISNRSSFGSQMWGSSLESRQRGCFQLTRLSIKGRRASADSRPSLIQHQGPIF